MATGCNVRGQKVNIGSVWFTNQQSKIMADKSEHYLRLNINESL